MGSRAGMERVGIGKCHGTAGRWKVQGCTQGGGLWAPEVGEGTEGVVF